MYILILVCLLALFGTNTYATEGTTDIPQMNLEQLIMTMQAKQAKVDIIKKNKPYGIYHLASKGSASWSDFTKKIFELKKRNVEVTAIDKSDFPRPALRPKYCVLDSTNALPNWESSLEEYLASKN